MERTLETLDQLESSKTALPDPELYIIVNGKPTKSKVVWCSIVDVNRVKKNNGRHAQALYEDVAVNVVDHSTKQVIEVVNSTTSSMLEKADESDNDGFQAYIVRSLDKKLPIDWDVDQYKVMNAQEHPLDRMQLHLDLMCFPALLPTGAFGENHAREVKINHVE